MRDAEVEYRLVKSRWPVRYGICGKAADGRVALVAPFSDDLPAMERRVAQLNEAQTPLEDMPSLFPNGLPLD